MKFLIDAQLPPALAAWLRERGHEAQHVSEVGLLAATDAAIAISVQEQASVLVTKDEGFAALRLPDRFRLLWLRCGNATNRALMLWLAPRWPEIERLLESGEPFIEVR